MSGHKQFSYDPERLDDDLFGIPLPLQDGSPVNAYVSISADGLFLIDGGFASELAQATLRAGIQTLGYDFDRDVRGLLVTHGHTDHVGAAQAILDNGGQVLAHRIETTEGRDQAFDEAFLKRHGLPEDGGPRSAAWRSFVWPEPTRLLEDGEQLRWGNLDLHVVWCPGHTPGLICLHEPNRGLLFTTDHVMRRAPAPVSVRNAQHDNPLGDYLASVDKLRSKTVQTVLPGHGRPFHHLRQRLDQINVEIQHQLDVIVNHLRHGPASAYELLTLSALRDRRPIATRYEVSLVLARLRFLERLGQVSAIDSADRVRYALAE
ncbi:MAG: MBL fold metallo-hydrolase [Chloroflexi bacterium]|nr:MBL fold metallo-hydrolase [Chloroflexota bacterium]